MSNEKPSRNIRKKRRLMEQSNGKCHWCGKQMRYSRGKYAPPHPDQITLDHIYPRGHPLRGTKSKGVVAACHACNNARGNMDADVWQAVVMARQGVPP